MAKSYVPQCIRIIRHLRLYINKHLTTMTPYLSAGQVAALNSIVTAASAFDGVNINETP